MVLVGVLVSSFVTEMIGIHAIFGAFLFGAAMPRQNAADMTTEILERLEQVSVLLLLPLFFVVTGMRTDIGGITGTGWWQFVLILAGRDRREVRGRLRRRPAHFGSRRGSRPHSRC